MPKQNKTSPAVVMAAPPTHPTTTGTTGTAGLPTPAQSTEIHANKSAFSALSFDGAFALPPAAISSPPNSRNSSVTSSDKAESDSSYNPDAIASSSVSKGKQPAKRKSSTSKSALQQQSSSDYTVPPPPTRSRKIIQMKPRAQAQDETSTFMAIAPDTTTASIKEEVGIIAPATHASTGTKRKQAASATTAQGRKMARKTAHSLIERRRRSKMNEEFGVLKDMIPACTGQEMHKLAILQASIDYMRYLEKCLADLKTAHASCATQPQIRSPTDRHISRPSTTHPSTRASSSTPPSDDSDMVDLPPIRQVLASHSTNSRRPHSHTSSQQQPHQQQSSRYTPISPALNPLSSTHGSPLHMGRVYQPPVPQASSVHPSPLFEGQQQRSMHKLGSFSLTSPIVAPMPGQAVVEDQEEATAALLMLNTDRRSWSERGSIGSVIDKRPSATTAAPASATVTTPTSASARSMSVRDLLTG